MRGFEQRRRATFFCDITQAHRTFRTLSGKESFEDKPRGSESTRNESMKNRRRSRNDFEGKTCLDRTSDEELPGV
jgi:hypothetical protein